MSQSNMSNTDRIEKQIVIKAPRSRVWRAIANAEEFGEWFLLDLKGQRFAVGQTVRGQITYPGYEHLTCEMVIESLQPEQRMSYRWHPYAIDPAVDYSQEPMTLVLFELRDVAEGTLLRVVESGFDALPIERRAEAFRMNEGGWEAQMQNIDKYVTTH